MARLLIAEDDDSIRFSLAGVLRSEGYQVDEAADGVEAARLGTRDDYALVILDIEMPGMNGLEACRLIRAQRADAAILILTGRTTELDTVAGLDAGADDYVAKPFRVAELLARVRAHVRRAGADELLAGDVRIDRAARRAYHAGRELQLSPREYDLLEHSSPTRADRHAPAADRRAVGRVVRLTEDARHARAGAAPQARRPDTHHYGARNRPAFRALTWRDSRPRPIHRTWTTYPSTSRCSWPRDVSTCRSSTSRWSGSRRRPTTARRSTRSSASRTP